MLGTKTLSKTALSILESGNLRGLVTEDLENAVSRLEAMLFHAVTKGEQAYYRKIRKRVLDEIAERAMMEDKK